MPTTRPPHARTALRFIVLVGVVSLFADMTYEGARSITGPYLALLGASATVVGVVAGFGELVGYGLRLASGYLADRTGRYWSLTIAGYGLNLLAVPLLALAGRWEIAALLIVAERAGKAVRTPARDVMLAHAGRQVGLGWAFGLHEALDQIGALLGPLLIAAVLYLRGSYPLGFGILLIPALLALGVLLVARLIYPQPRDLEGETPALDSRELPRAYWLYLAAAALIAAGYADFTLIAFHFKKVSLASDAWIPLFYTVAMGVDALAALALGAVFDRTGISILMGATVLSALFAPLVFLGGFSACLVGMALWGVGMGAQESVMRAAIAGMVPMHRRGSAYGLFSAAYGLSWFLGSAFMGLLYDRSIGMLVGFSVTLLLAALPLLALTARAVRPVH